MRKIFGTIAILLLIVLFSKTPIFAETTPAQTNSAIQSQEVQAQDVPLHGLQTSPTPSNAYTPSATTPNLLDFVTNPIGTMLGAVSDFIGVATVNLLDVRLPEVFPYNKIPDYIDAPLKDRTSKETKVVDFPETNPLFTIVPVPIMGSKVLATTDILDPQLFSPAGVFVAWLLILNVANLFFLVALVIIGVIVMLQVKVNLYAFKIILPRFLVAIVLAQFSWMFCDFAMDFTVIVAWVFTSFMTAFKLGGGISLGAMLGNDGMLKSFIEGIQMCMVIGGVGSMIPSATTPGTWANKLTTILPGLLAAGTGIVNGLKQVFDKGDIGQGAGAVIGAAPGVVLLWTGACEKIGGKIMPLVWIAVLGFVSSVLLYLAMTLVRAVLLYFLVIISPLICVIYIFPDFKKTVEKWTSSFSSLLIVYPLMILVYAVCYMVGFYLSLGAN